MDNFRYFYHEGSDDPPLVFWCRTHITLVRGLKGSNWKSVVANETMIQETGLLPVLH